MKHGLLALAVLKVVKVVLDSRITLPRRIRRGRHRRFRNPLRRAVAFDNASRRRRSNHDHAESFTTPLRSSAAPARRGASQRVSRRPSRTALACALPSSVECPFVSRRERNSHPRFKLVVLGPQRKNWQCLSPPVSEERGRGRRNKAGKSTKWMPPVCVCA